jgi:hypothetical protein
LVKPGIYDATTGECYIVRSDGSGAFYNGWADNPRWRGLAPLSMPHPDFFDVNCKWLKSYPKGVPPSPFKKDAELAVDRTRRRA